MGGLTSSTPSVEALARLDRRARRVAYRLDRCVICLSPGLDVCHIIRWDVLPRHIREWLLQVRRIHRGGVANVPVCPMCYRRFLQKGIARDKFAEGHHFFGRELDALIAKLNPTAHEFLDLKRDDYPKELQAPKTPREVRARIFFDLSSWLELEAREKAERAEFHRGRALVKSKIAARFRSLGTEALDDPS